MDYTMESLSVGDVRVCDDKFTVQSSSYDGTSLEQREHLIHGNQTYKSGVNLLKSSPPLHITISNHMPCNIASTDPNIQRQYGIGCNMNSENVYQTREEIEAPFERSFHYNGDDKISGNENHLFKQGASNGQAYIYSNESNLIQENMSAKDVDCLERYPLNSVGGARSVDNMVDLGQDGKIVSARCGDYATVVSNFLPETSHNKEQYFLYSSSERETCGNEALQDKTFQCQQTAQEGSYVYTQVHSHLSEMDFQRAENFSETQDTGTMLCLGNTCKQESETMLCLGNKCKQESETMLCLGNASKQESENMLCLGNTSKQESGTMFCVWNKCKHESGTLLCLGNTSQKEELFCPRTDVVDISKRQNGEVGFEGGSTGKETGESSVLVDGGFSEQMENASVVEALMTLQGEGGVVLGTESHSVAALRSHQAYESHVKSRGVSESRDRDANDHHDLPNSHGLPGLGSQTVNAKRGRKKQGRKLTLKLKKDHSRTDVDSTPYKLAKISRKSARKCNDDDNVMLRSVDKTDKVHKKGKHRVSRTRVAKAAGKEVVYSSKEGKDNKKANEPQAGPLVTDSSGSVSEDDTALVQSVESPPSPPAEKKRFKCKLCKRTWKFRKDLNKHMKTHTATKKFTCSVCSSGFINRTLLRKHLLAHSDSKLFTCQRCSYTCHSSAELKSHQQAHTRAEVFSCSECSFTSKHQKDLAKHMLVHSAAKVYHCQFCKFSSKRKYSLQRHVKTAHSSTQIHECSVCDFNTNAVDSFKVHVAMHASTRITSCIICGSVIKKRPNLIEHLLSHSNDEDTTCKECGKTCATSHEYILHLLNHRDLSSSTPDGVSQDSVFDLSTPKLNGSVDSTSGAFGFLARKNKVIMDTPTMEAKLSQMSMVASRLADMTKVVTLLNEKSKVVFQLAEISTLATELAVISGNVLQSYKNTYGVEADATRGPAKSPSASNNATDDSSDEDDDNDNDDVDDDDDDDDMSPELSIPAAKVKDEMQEHAYLPSDADMQIQVDLNGQPVSCVQKDDSFRSDSATSSKGIKLLKCSHCSMTFTDSRSLKRHLLGHDNVRPYFCQSCGRSFRRNEHLKKHMVTHSDERPFTCKDCAYAAKTEHRLKIHALCHSQTKAYACQHCTYTARTNYELNHHMKRHEPRSCSQCNFVCYSRAELKKHVFTHSSFDCNECEFTTNDRAEYTKHTKKHTLVQHLCCELCGYSCDTMKKFKYHKLRHDNKTPYQCPDCDYRCSSRASFDCHRLKHAGLKPYLCSFCGAAFRKTSHLNQHLLIHKDEKAFKCSECNYSCRTKHNLKEHEMTHSGEKPFSCKYCSFSCRRNKALQLHMLKHESSTVIMPSLQMPALQFSHHLQLPLQMPIMPS